METRIESLGLAQEPEAIALLARAFRDNPLNQAVVQAGATRRERVNRAGMRATLAAARGFADMRALTNGLPGSQERQIDGVLIGFAPGCHPPPAPPISTQLRCLLVQGVRIVRRWTVVYGEMTRVHPVEAHSYLGILGVRDEQQGRGFGRELLSSWLESVDELGVPSYLEADREPAVALYRKVGFEVVENLEIFGARIWCMRRPARERPRSLEGTAD